MSQEIIKTAGKQEVTTKLGNIPDCPCGCQNFYLIFQLEDTDVQTNGQTDGWMNRLANWVSQKTALLLSKA